MRLGWLMCSWVLVAACDRGPESPSRPVQPVSPSEPMKPVTTVPIAASPTHEARARPEPEPIVEEPTIAPEPEPERPDVPEKSSVEDQTPGEPSRETSEVREPLETDVECCRTCRKGKACGDTCVARDRECTVEPGCACDA